MVTDDIKNFVKKEGCIQDILDKVNNIIVRESRQMEYDYPYFHTMVDTELENYIKRLSFVNTLLRLQTLLEIVTRTIPLRKLQVILTEWSND